MLCSKSESWKSLLCGPLCISACSAFNVYFYAEAAEIHREPAEKTNQICDFLCNVNCKRKIAKDKVRTTDAYNSATRSVSPDQRGRRTWRACCRRDRRAHARLDATATRRKDALLSKRRSCRNCRRRLHRSGSLGGSAIRDEVRQIRIAPFLANCRRSK